MAEQPGLDPRLPDAEKLAEGWTNIAERSQRIVSDFLVRQSQEATTMFSDPLGIGSAFMEWSQAMMTNPNKLVEAQMTLWQDYLTLWQSTANRMMGADSTSVVEPDRGDKRFKDDAWQENEIFNYIKQSYLLTSRWLTSTINDVDGLDDKTAEKVDFYTRQFVDAFSPSNFLMTNPEVLRTTMETGGENLINGLQNMLTDLERGKGQLKISMTDMEAFTIGENIATTPGQVVFRNNLIELIQYTPTTENVAKRPVLFIPPWINKFYILDLRAKNSMVKWLVDQGHTVFLISWVNPDSELAEKTFADYVTEGVLSAVDAIEQTTGEKEINAAGYCIGGTLLATTLAYSAKTGEDRIKSATFFTTMTDFEEPGELGVFIDDDTIAFLESQMEDTGYLDGSTMAGTFNMMRSNDLVWSFVVNNYLLGKDPFPFDLLYWNSDSTRMPRAMHSYYLRQFYQNNALCKPNVLDMHGVPIDLSEIKVPCYMVSTKDDHIAPWKSTFRATSTFSGPVRFVLAASGHIAGVINPPAAGKYCHWINTRKVKDPDKWLDGAKEADGSWWPDWDGWLKKQGGNKEVPARDPEKGKLPALEPAPGSYVKIQN
ncbi:MAG: PHA/PHB synthase family protein [Magnetovibrionaceae bacterium]